jgi:cysteinyl-tRNA synthetase
MQRILTHYFNIPVTHVMGMTDVDDKIIKRSAERSIPMRALARQYEELFWTDMTALGVVSAALLHLSLCSRFEDLWQYVASASSLTKSSSLSVEFTTMGMN